MNKIFQFLGKILAVFWPQHSLNFSPGLTTIPGCKIHPKLHFYTSYMMLIALTSKFREIKFEKKKHPSLIGHL